MSTPTVEAPGVPLAADFHSDAVIHERLATDPKAVLFGCHPPRDWVEEFGPQRVRTCAIAESSFTGMAVGAALCGLHPIVDLVRSSFTFVAMDQIANQAAKLGYMSGGRARLSLTIRALARTELHLAAQHEQNVYSMFLQVAGLRIVLPGTIEDAPALMRAALDEPNPVLMFESPRIAPGPPGAEPVVEPVELGRARTLRTGDDVTIVAIGGMVPLALAAAEEVAAAGIGCAVLDPRTLAPLDVPALRAAARRTGRLVVVDEGPPAGSIATEIITAVVEDPDTFAALRRPPARVTGAPVPMPFNPDLETSLLPSVDGIVHAIRRTLDGRDR